MLSKKDDNVNARDNKNNTSLFWAAKNGNSRSCITWMSCDNLYNEHILTGRTYFNKYFFHSGNQTVVETLLRNGADVNSKDNNDNTPLIWASGNGNFIKLKIVK